MTINYHQFQEEVFNYLLAKNQRNPDFTFTVRQKASKGAETNYFIGTEKSKYFGFTCWDIPVYFPGSSADLTNFIFWKGTNTYHFKFQYLMAKTAIGTQSEGDLYFGRLFIEKMKEVGISAVVGDENKKMLYVQIHSLNDGYDSINGLMAAFEIQYNLLDPLLNSAITETKNQHPEWIGGKLSSAKFETMVKKMRERIEKFKRLGELSTEEIGEEILIPELPIETEISRVPLNQILYGPPGTGKTYNSINKAVAIANPAFNITESSRTEIKEEYERLVKARQIEFITFHQSMSYEDFIEGIKPVEPELSDTFLKYAMRDGIFKRLAVRASIPPVAIPKTFSISDSDFNKATYYKISLGNTNNADDDSIYEWCIEHGYIALGWGDDIDFTGKSEAEIRHLVPDTLEKTASQCVNYFIHYIKQNDYVIVTYGNYKFRAIGRVTGEYEYKKIDGLHYNQFRKVEWLLKDVELPYEEMYNKQFSQRTIYKLSRTDIKKEFFVKNTLHLPIIQTGIKNYVLIIDEINRGNVSQIFGELITLIEEDKRTGMSEALSTILPYSKELFSVPSNLYILGTMNTADRSVEALDTALRRRFVFEEMESMPHLLSAYHLLQRLWIKYWMVDPDHEKWDKWKQKEGELMELTGMEIDRTNYIALADKYEKKDGEALWMNMDPSLLFSDSVKINEGIELDKILVKINKRLRVLLTKDHNIGHAWFMNVNSLLELQETFKSKIIPLLQEFFYNDYAKIGLVLGDAFVQQKVTGNNLFAKFTDANGISADYESKIIYTLVDPLEIEVAGFKAIYK